jgi:hypothetical protein
VFESNAPKGGGVPDLRLFRSRAGSAWAVRKCSQCRSVTGPGTSRFPRRGFAYLTDCNGIPDTSLELLQGLDCLVLDALRHRPHPTHFTLAEAVVMAGRIGAARTYFTPHRARARAAGTCAHCRPDGLAHDGLDIEVQ